MCVWTRRRCIRLAAIERFSNEIQWCAKVLAPYVRELSQHAWTEASRTNIRESYRTRERVYINNLKLERTVDIIAWRRKCAGDQILLTGKRDDHLFYITGTTDIDLPLQSLVSRRSPSGLSSIILWRSRKKERLKIEAEVDDLARWLPLTTKLFGNGFEETMRQ